MQGSKASRKYKCSVCKQEFTEIENIRAHIKATHLVHVTCPLCDKVFANRVELSIHKKLHFQAAPDHLFQPTESINQASEVKGNESDEGPCSGSHKGNAEVDTPGNHGEVKPLSSFSFHASSAVNTEQQTLFPSNRVTVNNQEGGGKIQLAELNNIISPDHLPQKRKEDINEYSVINNDKECVEILSSPKKIVCVPLGGHWKVTALSVAPKETEADEVKCCEEQDLPFNDWDDKTDTRADAVRGANKEGQPKRKCHVESNARAEEGTNKLCLPLDTGDDSYSVIPWKVTRYVRSSKCIEMESDVVEASVNTHLNHTKGDSLMPREYSCNVCNNKFNTIARVQSHMKEAHVNHLICLTCNEKFLTISQYLSHSNSHLNGSLPLPEEIENCNENSGEESSVKSKTSPTTKVEICGLAQETKKCASPKLRKKKEYKCKLCREKCFSVEDMRSHVKKVHLAGLTCTLCNKIFANKYSLMDHSKKHYGSNSNKNVMQSVENSDACLNMSPKIELEENETSLVEVSSSFNDIVVNSVCDSNSGGQLHENISYKCDKCSLYFDSESPLKRHQKTHKNAMYKCGVCEFASFSKEVVIKHLTQECHSFLEDFNESY